MTAFVLRCLKLADERGMASIAFPALGTGVLGFPADVVARLLFETIEEYDLSNPETGISSVSLVVYQEDKPAVQVNAKEVLLHVNTANSTSGSTFYHCC